MDNAPIINLLFKVIVSR